MLFYALDMAPAPLLSPPPPITKPTPTPSTQEIVAEELKKLSIGRILFNPPEKMKVGVKERVEVHITQNTATPYCYRKNIDSGSG
jgi:hypothetical protein